MKLLAIVLFGLLCLSFAQDPGSVGTVGADIPPVDSVGVVEKPPLQSAPVDERPSRNSRSPSSTPAGLSDRGSSVRSSPSVNSNAASNSGASRVSTDRNSGSRNAGNSGARRVSTGRNSDRSSSRDITDNRARGSTDRNSVSRNADRSSSRDITDNRARGSTGRNSVSRNAFSRNSVSRNADRSTRSGRTVGFRPAQPPITRFPGTTSSRRQLARLVENSADIERGLLLVNRGLANSAVSLQRNMPEASARGGEILARPETPSAGANMIRADPVPLAPPQTSQKRQAEAGVQQGAEVVLPAAQTVQEAVETLQEGVQAAGQADVAQALLNVQRGSAALSAAYAQVQAAELLLAEARVRMALDVSEMRVVLSLLDSPVLTRDARSDLRQVKQGLDLISFPVGALDSPVAPGQWKEVATRKVTPVAARTGAGDEAEASAPMANWAIPFIVMGVIALIAVVGIFVQILIITRNSL